MIPYESGLFSRCSKSQVYCEAQTLTERLKAERESRSCSSYSTETLSLMHKICDDSASKIEAARCTGVLPMANEFLDPIVTGEEDTSPRQSFRVVTDPSPFPTSIRSLFTDSVDVSSGSLRMRMERGNEVSTTVSNTWRSLRETILTSLLPQNPTAASGIPSGASATLAISLEVNAVRL